MKILYLIKSFAVKAGTERVMSEKMNWLAANGYNIVLVTYEQGDHPFAFQLDSSIRYYDLATRFFDLGRFNLVSRCFKYYERRKQFGKRLQLIVDKESPDFIISTTYSGLLLNKILRIKTDACRLLESHSVYRTFWKATNYRNHIVLFALYSAYDRAFLKSVKGFDEMVTLTSADANMWKSHVNHVTIIPNPIPYIPKTLPKLSDNHRIICAGRLENEKGFDLLIEAFSLIASQCGDWHIDIYGDGGEKERLRQMISAKCLEDKVRLCCPTSQIFSEYMQSNLFVLSSRNEGFGLVLLEAMSCGLACVSFDCPFGPAEIIENGENGLLARNGDVKHLSEQMLWMIEHPIEREQMGKAARQSVMRYDKDVIMQKWVSLFKSYM